MKLSIKGMWYAKRCHSEVNQSYDGNPYSLHLQMVADVAHKYLHLLPEGDIERIVAACWAHDVIEDCRQTYNDVKKELGSIVADMVYRCTNEKGRTRKERASEKFYDELTESRHASFVKICDRIANMQYSLAKRSSMATMYAKEADDFCLIFTGMGYNEMLSEIQSLKNASIEIISTE